MLQNALLEDILEKEEDLISYCQTLTNVNPLDESDAQDTIKNHLDTLEDHDVLKLCTKRDISVSNNELSILLVQEINSGEFMELEHKTANALKLITEILNTTKDIEDLKVKLLEMSNDNDLIWSCFC